MNNSIIIGEWLVRSDLNIIRTADRQIALQSRQMALLCLLASRVGELVTKADILESVWSNAAVTDNSITRAISQLRMALNDDFRNPRYIMTIPTKGYCLVASVGEAIAANDLAGVMRLGVGMPRVERAHRLDEVDDVISPTDGAKEIMMAPERIENVLAQVRGDALTVGGTRSVQAKVRNSGPRHGRAGK